MLECAATGIKRGLGQDFIEVSTRGLCALLLCCSVDIYFDRLAAHNFWVAVSFGKYTEMNSLSGSTIVVEIV